jgi:hypothetical protein
MSTQKVLRQEDTSFVHVKRGQKEYDQCKAIFEHEKYIFTQAIKKYLSFRNFYTSFQDGCFHKLFGCVDIFFRTFVYFSSGCLRESGFLNLYLSSACFFRSNQVT